MQLSDKIYNEFEERVKEHLKDHPKRFTHILGVVKMSEYLAKRYNVDILKAKVASLLHDYSKYDDNDLSPLDNEEREYCTKYPYLAHAYLSKLAAEREFGIDDDDILNAIHNHVIGRIGMSRLEEIVFISDFTEEGREYEDCIKCREVLLNGTIEDAIINSYEACMRHNEPHPAQVDILKYYKEKNMLKTIIKSLDRVKCDDIIVYDLKGISPLFDNVVIATVDSSRQGDAVTGYLEYDLNEAGYTVRGIEGKNTTWVLVDCHDVLVHVFTREEREHFNLEKMYMDVPKLDVEELRK